MRPSLRTRRRARGYRVARCYCPPATVILPTRIEPVWMCERGSTSLPTASMSRNIALRLPAMVRSEEHTSELQSLMRISYAVFFLKIKKTLLCTYELPSDYYSTTELSVIYVSETTVIT